MPTPDLEERFRRWLKLTAEMHDNANFTPNESIAWEIPLSDRVIRFKHWEDGIFI